MDKFVDALSMEIHSDAKKTIDKVYADYDRQAQELVNHIEDLAEQDLDALQNTAKSSSASWL